MSESLLLKATTHAVGARIPTCLELYEDGLEVTTLRGIRRISQHVSYDQIAQVAVVRKLFFADLIIETRGGGALRVAGITKSEAQEAHALILEQLRAS